MHPDSWRREHWRWLLSRPVHRTDEARHGRCYQTESGTWVHVKPGCRHTKKVGNFK